MNRIEELEAKTKSSIDSYNDYQKLVSSFGRDPSLGDIFVLPLCLNQPIVWTLLLSHPDQREQFFCVPVDSLMWKSVTDVEVSEHPLGPMMLRCNHGTWLSTSDLLEARRIGRLKDGHLKEGQQIMRAMVTGELVESEDEADVADDPDYEDWCQEIDDALGEVERWKHRSAKVIDLSTWRSARSQISAVALAAASSSPFEKLKKNLDDKGSVISQIPLAGGQLDVTGSLESLWLVFSGDRPPKATFHLKDGQKIVADWLKNPSQPIWRSSTQSITEVRTILVMDDEACLELPMEN